MRETSYGGWDMLCEKGIVRGKGGTWNSSGKKKKRRPIYREQDRIGNCLKLFGSMKEMRSIGKVVERSLGPLNALTGNRVVVVEEEKEEDGEEGKEEE